MIKVGITGSIGTGKSLVSNYFKELGHLVISADEINRKLLTDITIIKSVNKLLFDLDSSILDKKKAAKLIFSNKKKKKELEEFIHPLIYDKMVKQIKECNDKIIFLEIPLLFETNFKELTDYNIVVYAEELIQMDRIIKRDGISSDEALKRIESQMPLIEKVIKADYVINNSDTILNTHKQLDNWYMNFIRRL